MCSGRFLALMYWILNQVQFEMNAEKLYGRHFVVKIIFRLIQLLFKFGKFWNCELIKICPQ